MCPYATRAKSSPGDEDIPIVHASSSINNSSSNIKNTNQGALTGSRAKKLQEQVNLFLSNLNFNTSENIILPRCSTLVVLRNTYQEEHESDHEDRTNTVKNGPADRTATVKDGPAKRNYHNS